MQTAPTSPTDHRGLFYGQAVLIAIVLFIVVFWPRSGEAAVLVPLGNSDQRKAWLWLADEEASLAGLRPGSRLPVVIIPSTRSTLTAIQHGLLPISADNPICRSGII